MVVANGEIYNHNQLRRELQERGKRFISKNDCEPIATMFEEEGPSCVSRLHGMFAFAALDKHTGKLYLARDRFGIKPLYYQVKNGRITTFASEIKSLLAMDDQPQDINDTALLNFLSFQYNPGQETFFSGIHRLPPGHVLTVDLKTNQYSMSRYWQMSFDPDHSLSDVEAADQLGTALEESVTSHLQSDVPLGVFLSSGVDSALLAALARRARPREPLRSFTIGGATRNEFAAAADLAEHLGTIHTEIQLTPQSFFEALSSASWHFDEPVADPSAIALYRLAEQATKQVTVAISGDGADELFGGYRIYREPYAVNRVRDLPKPVRSTVMLGAKLPERVRGSNFLRRAAIPLPERFIGNAKVFTRAEAKQLWSGGGLPDFHDLAPLYAQNRGLSEQQQMQMVDIEGWLPGDILAKSDKMTMAHSLELRVPYLDPSVADVATRLPDSLKFADGTTKSLLREVARKYLPEADSSRPKLGFPVPMAMLFRQDPSQLASIVENPLIQDRFDVDVIKELIQDHRSGRVDNARKLFLLKTLAVWNETFMTGTQIDTNNCDRSTTST